MKPWLIAFAFVSSAAIAQTAPLPGQPQADSGPSLETAGELPLTYVGADDRVSIGIDRDGNTQGELMGVFARNDARAVIAQLWWDHGGAGGFQTDYNWLLGVTPEQARDHPDAITVAKLSFGMNQDTARNRQAALAFAIERKRFFLDAYVAAKASSAHDAGALTSTAQTEQNGTDAAGNYIQTITETTTIQLQSQPYNYSVGLHGGHFSDALGARFNAGVDYDSGNQGAHETRASFGIDKYVGTRGWSVSGIAEHAEQTDPISGSHGDNRWWLMLRYEFGGSGAFVKSNQVGDTAWIMRALGSPVVAAPHSLRTYVSRGRVTTRMTPGAKQYTSHRPVAQNDSSSVVENSTNNAIAVLANDSDADGNPISITAVTQPAHGSAQIVGRQISYTPIPNYAGDDRFTYTISDNKGLSATASVSVTVLAGALPIAHADAATTDYDTPVTIDVLANDTDPNGYALSLVSVTNPAHGTVQIIGNAIVYTPQTDFYGMDAFSYTASDSHGGTSSAVVSVTVRQSGTPVAADDRAATGYNTPITIAVLANDSDPNSLPLAITSVTAPAHGGARTSGSAIIYTPQPGFYGTDTFSYTVSDGRGGMASATVTVSVSAPGYPVANDDNATTAYNTPVTISVLANDTDPNGFVLNITSVGAPAHGSAQIDGNAIAYRPQAGFYGGTDTLSYTIDNGHGGTATATITITVQAPASPTANDDTATTAYNTPVSIDVLANDTDPNGFALSIAAVATPAHGSAKINGNTIAYTPQATLYGGSDTFSYTIDDGHGGSATANVSVTVGAPPSPVAGNYNVTVGVHTPITIFDTYRLQASINVLTNSSDPNGFPLTVASVGPTAHGGAVTNNGNGNLSYVHQVPADRNLQGVSDDSFTYTLSNGHGGTATGTVHLQWPIYVVSGTVTAEGGGTISPSFQTIAFGNTTQFTLTAYAGYAINSDGTTDNCGAGGSLGTTTYTTGPITDDCTVSAAFSYVIP
ncbi:MAG: Ig-like domain-containing protein [Rudaea sp.]